MQDFLLFIDTESSDLPKKWDVPYSKQGNWPHAVQVSWIIYTKEGEVVKEENHYINNNDFEISSSAIKIHGITREHTNTKGINRKDVLNFLTTDLNQYQPLIVGHFIELDFHLIGADSYREGMENPLSRFSTFCTMLATTHLIQNPAKKFLKLCDLYNLLFNESIANHHNAMEDARATALCFFELLRRGEIDDAKISKQEKFFSEPTSNEKRGCSFMLLVSFLLLILIITFL